MIEEYIGLKEKELIDLSYISVVLAALFSITATRFAQENTTFFFNFLSFLIFIFILLFLRMTFMKIVAYVNGFEIEMKMTYFDRYGLRFYDRVSYTMDGKPVKGVIPTVNLKRGIATPIIAILIYIFSLGIVIFPCMWRYETRTIPHKYNKIKQKYEDLEGANRGFSVTDYRYSKVLFSGFIFYFFAGLLIKLFTNVLNLNFYNWFLFAMYWIAFVSIAPLLGTEGYELFKRGKFGWISAITILILSMIGLLIFTTITSILTITTISSFIAVLYMIYKNMM